MLYADPAEPRLPGTWSPTTRKKVGQDPNEIIAPYYDAYNVLLHAIQKAGDVEDTAKVAAAFPQVLPMNSLQGDEMTWAHQQIRTYDYVGVLTDGRSGRQRQGEVDGPLSPGSGPDAGATSTLESERIRHD